MDSIIKWVKNYQTTRKGYFIPVAANCFLILPTSSSLYVTTMCKSLFTYYTPLKKSMNHQRNFFTKQWWFINLLYSVRGLNYLLCYSHTVEIFSTVLCSHSNSASSNYDLIGCFFLRVQSHNALRYNSGSRVINVGGESNSQPHNPSLCINTSRFSSYNIVSSSSHHLHTSLECHRTMQSFSGCVGFLLTTAWIVVGNNAVYQFFSFQMG